MKEWFTATEIAERKLPGLPVTHSAVVRVAKRDGWQTRLNLAGAPLARRRKGRGGGWEYHYTLFPVLAQKRLIDMAAAEKKKARAAGADGNQAERPKGTSELWDWFDRQDGKTKNEARRRLDVLNEVHDRRRGGLQKTVAVAFAAGAHGVSAGTVHGWFRLVRGVGKADWLPHLAPRYVGRTKTAECDETAWEFLKADYLRNEKPPFEACYDRLQMAAEKNGWKIPSSRTLQRRIEREFPHAVIVRLREGADAARRLYPWQERDRTQFHALEAVNADFHTADVWVQFTKDLRCRPSIIAIQDLYSNKIIAWRVDVNPTATAVRLCFHDVFRDYGIPDLAFLDNGREFASKMITGGQKTRYRFKVTAKEMDGLLTQLGTEVHWTTPYSGQSKPVERSFREFCQRIWTHPAFAGAYTGNSPVNKPANYGSKAVPLEQFLQVLAEGVRLYNAKEKRNTRVCGRVLSFDQAFANSYEANVIRKAGPEHLRMAMLAAENVTARKPNGSVHLYGSRFWAEFLNDHIGKPVTLRFDPENLQAGVHVYQAGGAYLGFAECWEAGDFLNVDQAREHGRNRRKYLKGVKEIADLEVTLKPQDLLKMLPDDAEEPPRPEAKLIRPVARNLAVAAEAEADPDAITDDDYREMFRAGLELQVLQGGLEE